MQKSAKTRQPAAAGATTKVSPKSRRVGPRAKAFACGIEITSLAGSNRPKGSRFSNVFSADEKRCLWAGRCCPDCDARPSGNFVYGGAYSAKQQQDLVGAPSMAGS